MEQKEHERGCGRSQGMTCTCGVGTVNGVAGDAPCLDCGRDNRNATHDALEQIDHLAHSYRPEAPPRDDLADIVNAVSGPSRTTLSFSAFSETNESRCARWHPGFPAEDSWTLADWSNALAGETGELCNVIKKIRRIETDHRPGREDPPIEELRRKAADEMGDVLAYLDLLATKMGLDLGTVATRKFNAVSVREGHPERLHG